MSGSDRSGVLRGKSKPRLKTHQLFNVGLNACCRNLLEPGGNLRISRHRWGTTLPVRHTWQQSVKNEKRQSRTDKKISFHACLIPLTCGYLFSLLPFCTVKALDLSPGRI